MAGKKGMKQARPRTQEERDRYALSRIEELLDSVVLGGKNVAKWTPVRMQALKIRYDKLRATLGATEITDKREGWVDAMKRMAVEERRQQPGAAGAVDQKEDSTQVSDNTVVRH
jgi:predicted MPP superfamily phosphohydrolase